MTTIDGYLRHWTSRCPEWEAVLHGRTVLTFADLERAVDRVAGWLLSAGLARGQRIATILDCGPYYVIALLAALRIGAVIVPLDTRYRSADIRRFLSQCDPSLVIAQTKGNKHDIAALLQPVVAEFPDARFVMTDDTRFSQPSFRTWMTTSSEFPVPLENNVSDAADALIVFTGGTTGVPKGAVLTQRNIVSYCESAVEKLFGQIPVDERSGRRKILANLPPSHVGGTVELILTSIVGGYEMHLMASWSPVGVIEAMKRQDIRYFAGVPTMYSIIFSLPELDPEDFSRVDLAIISGEKVGREILDKTARLMTPNIVVGYGSTEAGPEVAITSIGDDHDKIAAGFVGTAIGPDVGFRVVDDSGRDLPAGAEGELLVRSDMTIDSYFRMPAEDAQSFDDEGFFKTGDIARVESTGELYIVGRKKQIIRVGSYTVVPSEIEDVVYENFDVHLAVAVGLPDEILGETVGLYVVPRTPISERDVQAACERELAGFKTPKAIIIETDTTTPTTRIGKIDRESLRRKIAEQSRRCFPEGEDG